MPYVAFLDHFNHYLGKVFGNGQCVAFVKKVAHTPPTHTWKPGPLVRGNFWLPKGTAIATFRRGRYPNQGHGY
ncbi:MAG: BPSL0067 family protein, partial [Gammaproteobacteria bacterium]